MFLIVLLFSGVFILFLLPKKDFMVLNCAVLPAHNIAKSSMFLCSLCFANLKPRLSLSLFSSLFVERETLIGLSSNSFQSLLGNRCTYSLILASAGHLRNSEHGDLTFLFDIFQENTTLRDI